MADADRDRNRPGDVEIGAFLSAESVRFRCVPDGYTQVQGVAQGHAPTSSERENLAEEIQPRVTYRHVRVRWRAIARIEGTC
jgi:hypothetical protein